MFNVTKSSLAAGLIAVAAFGGATPALAGQCSAAGVNPLANAPTMPKGVTDTVIGAVDLGPEINVDGRQLRIVYGGETTLPIPCKNIDE